MRIAQSTMRLTLGVCDIRPPMARYVSRYLRSFSCSETWVCPCTIKVVLHVPLVYFRRRSREKKYQALHTCTTSMFTFRSVGAWEREATVLSWLYISIYHYQTLPQVLCMCMHGTVKLASIIMSIIGMVYQHCWYSIIRLSVICQCLTAS